MRSRLISRRDFLKAIGLGIAATSSPLLVPANGKEYELRSPPNIVLIMVDDMGYSDMGCYGGDIQTPNLDSLAENGIRFTHFYNSARCSPARASLMTGLYPHQAGMGWMPMANLGTDGYAGDLNDRCRTIAECLRPAGYSTYMCGKWHLTYDRYQKPDSPKHSWPCQRGFDRYFGTLAGGGSYFTPHTLTVDNEQIEAPEDFYYTDAISNSACKFIHDHSVENPDNPFFLYAAYTAPHWPLHAKPENIAKYRGKFMDGWDVIRRRKFYRMKDMGILEKHWGLSERDPLVPAWNNLDPAKQDEFDLRMAIYAAQIDSVDQGVGRIIQNLETRDLLNNTLIIFLSDNGGCHVEIHSDNPDPANFGTNESYESYGRPWANVSNTPFREFKSWTHEGGISTPLIAYWPAGIKLKGKMNNQPGHITDIMPTCLELAGASYPRNDKLHALVGKSLVPGFQGNAVKRDCIFWEHEANRALRQDKWKLVSKGIKGEWELYDMEEDRSELNNLAKSSPKRLREMAELWNEIARQTNVLPLDGRNLEEKMRFDTWAHLWRRWLGG